MHLTPIFAWRSARYLCWPYVFLPQPVSYHSQRLFLTSSGKYLNEWNLLLGCLSCSPQSKGSKGNKLRVYFGIFGGVGSGRHEVLWTDYKPHSPSLCTTWGKEVKNFKGKLSLWRRERWAESVLRFVLTTHYPTLLLSGNKFN